MTSENVLSTLFNNIADAIRAKTGSTAMMKPAEFLKQIRNINSSNGDNSDNDDNSGDPPIMFTFYIENTEYYAIHGMTWGEWVDSEYNTNGYFIDNGGGVQIGESWVYYYDKETNYTYGQDSAVIITAGRAYGLTHGGGCN